LDKTTNRKIFDLFACFDHSPLLPISIKLHSLRLSEYAILHNTHSGFHAREHSFRLHPFPPAISPGRRPARRRSTRIFPCYRSIGHTKTLAVSRSRSHEWRIDEAVSSILLCLRISTRLATRSLLKVIQWSAARLPPS